MVRLFWAIAIALLLHSFLLLISFPYHKEPPVPAVSSIAVKMATKTETLKRDKPEQDKNERKNTEEIPPIEQIKNTSTKKIVPLKKKRKEIIQNSPPEPLPTAKEEPIDNREKQEQNIKPVPQEKVNHTPLNMDGTEFNAQEVHVSTKAVPLYQHNPAPKYPALARKRGIEGTVLLHVHVDREGKVVDLKLAETSGHKVLDKAAIRAVERWIFSPGKTNNENIAMWVHVPIRFTLQD